MAILGAANGLVEQRGFSAVTIAAIAARARTTKTTIYRWWPGKAAVVMDAFLTSAEPLIEVAPSGSIREELTAQMKALADFFQHTGTGRTITALITEAQSDSELAEAMRDRWLAPRRAAAARAFDRARRRGELRDDVSDDALIDTLYGALYLRLLLGHADIDDALIDSIVDIVLTGASAAPTTRDTP